MDGKRRIRELEQLVAEQARTIEELRAELKRAQERMEELERTAARQAAPFRRREALKIAAGAKKRPGRPMGHVGVRRPVPAVDEEAEVPLSCCPQCGGPVDDCRPVVQFIEELPPVKPHVTRLVTYEGKCPCCGVVHSSHPLQTSRGQGAAGVMLGPRALAVATLLNKHLGLTMGVTRRVLKQLCGLSISRGGLAQAVSRVSQRVQQDYEALRDKIRGSPVVYADETSWWVGEPGWWLWIFTTPQATYYRIEKCRGGAVAFETLGDFSGTLVSDCLASYEALPYAQHKCYAHHLRALHEREAALSERGAMSSYLTAWKNWLHEVLEAWRDRVQYTLAAWTGKIVQIVRAVNELLDQSPEHPEEVKFRDRMRKQRERLLGCLRDPRVDPTNNAAERGLRPSVIIRKNSCGNRTLAGRDATQTLRSLGQTCDQQGHDFLQFLVPRLTLAPQAG